MGIVCGFIPPLLIETTFPRLPAPRPCSYSVCALKSVCVFPCSAFQQDGNPSAPPAGAGVVLSALPYRSAINSSMRRELPALLFNPYIVPKD